MATLKLDDFYNVEDLALELGATVEYPDGRKFNTAGTQAKRQAKAPSPAPALAPAPAPAPDPNTALMQQMVQQLAVALSRPVSVTLPDIPAPQIVVQPSEVTAQPTSWVFEFERNPNGTIKRINAKPNKE